MLYMLYNDGSTCIRMDLVVGNMISEYLIIILEFKVRVSTMFWNFIKDECVLIMEKDVLSISNDVLEF